MEVEEARLRKALSTEAGVVGVARLQWQMSGRVLDQPHCVLHVLSSEPQLKALPNVGSQTLFVVPAGGTVRRRFVVVAFQSRRLHDQRGGNRYWVASLSVPHLFEHVIRSPIGLNPFAPPGSAPCGAHSNMLRNVAGRLSGGYVPDLVKKRGLFEVKR